MAGDSVLVKLDRREQGIVATVSVNNAARLNCVGSEQVRSLAEAVEALAAEEDLRVLIVTGEGGRSFVGGADLQELGALSPAGARDFLTLVHRMCKALRDLPVPVIARVNGFCLGAGLELMAACDLHLASDNAVFGMPEVRVGVPSVAEAALLPQLIGWGRTRLMVFTGDNVDATTALSWGLIEKVVPAKELDAAVESWVSSILISGPKAIRLQKGLVREWEAMPVNDAIEAGIRCIYRAYQTDEPARMAAAAIERLNAKRKQPSAS